MKKLVLFFLITIFTLNMNAQNKRAMTVEDLWNMERIGSYDVSPDGKQIVFDLTVYSMEENKGATSVWIMKSDGTSRTRLLEKASSPQFSKDGKKIYFKKNSQVFSCNLKGKNKKQITSFYSGVGSPNFSIDENQILFSSMVYPECTTQECNEKKDKEREESKVKAEIFTELMYRHWNDWRGPKISHLFLFDIKKDKYIDLNLNSKFDVPPIALGSSNDFSFSPTSSEIAFTMNESDFLATSTNNDIFLMKVSDANEKGKTHYQKISVSGGNDIQPIFSPNGKYIAYCSMERAGFEADKQRIMLYDLTSKTTTNLTADYDFSAGEMIWSNDSKAIYFTAANRVYNSIFKIDIETQLLSAIVENVTASSIKLSKDGSTLFFKNQKSTMPNEIFSIKTTKTDFKKITDVNGKLLAQLEMNDVETFWATGAEETQVQSILVKPPFFDKTKKYPMMFLIHGGPQGHWEDDFHFRWNLQMFAAKGYVVVAPNPRGSVGYGQKFTDEISKDWGGKAYVDLMNSYDYAVSTFDFIDENNTFACGASYGGYMINWIAGHTDRFNALVCHAGVFNLTSMYGTTEELWFPEWENDGTPWENRAAYEKWSPHMFVENFKTPMLVVHGAYDFRVPFGQAMELFTSLQKMGVESKMLYFPDETHFVVKPQNARLWWNTIYDWLQEHQNK